MSSVPLTFSVVDVASQDKETLRVTLQCEVDVAASPERQDILRAAMQLYAEQLTALLDGYPLAAMHLHFCAATESLGLSLATKPQPGTHPSLSAYAEMREAFPGG